MRRFEAFLWVLVAVLAALAALCVGYALQRTAAALDDSIPPCTYEDASGQPLPCVWIAPERGNGEGRSFLAIEGRDGGPVLVYLDEVRGMASPGPANAPTPPDEGVNHMDTNETAEVVPTDTAMLLLVDPGALPPALVASLTTPNEHGVTQARVYATEGDGYYHPSDLADQVEPDFLADVLRAWSGE
jgi:hypothetical protein